MITFVVLHYNNLNVTKECVNTLLKLENFNNSAVVVVDNKSPNNSGCELVREFHLNNNVHIVLNNENLGFAQGNNIGYSYAKEKLLSDIIIVMNNDVFIKQKGFIAALEEQSKKYDILGPKITNRLGQNQNPFRTNLVTNKKVFYLYLYNKLTSVILNVPVINYGYLIMIDKLKKNKIKSEASFTGLQDLVLHGSCVIYTKNWIQKENFAFVPETFMYFEEDFLAEYAKERGYKVGYTENIEVIHLEDASVDSTFVGNLSKKKFISKNMSDSVYKFLKFRKCGKY
ncbi:TPA: glycosyltransferase [Streptococcus suis]